MLNKMGKLFNFHPIPYSHSLLFSIVLVEIKGGDGDFLEEKL